MEFLTYAHRFIEDGLLFCRALEEAGSFKTPDEYRRVRRTGARYATSRKTGNDFENGAAEWDTVKSNIFVRTAIRYIQCLPAARRLKSVVVPFELEALGK